MATKQPKFHPMHEALAKSIHGMIDAAWAHQEAEKITRSRKGERARAKTVNAVIGFAHQFAADAYKANKRFPFRAFIEACGLAVYDVPPSLRR